MLKYCITLLLLLTLTICFAASTGRLAGKVTDTMGRPLAYANVVLQGTHLGTQTKENGTYKIINIAPGTYTVIFSAMGYEKYPVEGVRITKNSTATVNVKLKIKGVAIEGVTVNAEHDIISSGITGSSREIHMDQSSKVTAGRVEGMMALEAGANTGDNHIRGGRENEVSYTADGMPVSEPCRYHHHKISPTPPRRVYNTEDYAKVEDNPFEQVSTEPLSTFSIDVDTATYSNVRRLLNNRTLPDKSYVRIEELLNYFHYDYPETRNEHPFSVYTELGTCPWNQKHQLLHIGLKGREVDYNSAPMCNLVFLLDVSGSMALSNKLPLVKESMKLLVNQLRPEDRIAIVTYASTTGIVLPSTTGRNKQVFLDAIDRLHAGGSTAGGAGISLAYEVATHDFIKGGNNRVILCTDGDFNVGESSDEAMQQLIEQKRKEGVFLTVLGFGMGNIKDNKMEVLADKGNGNYAYIDTILEANKVLVEEMGGTLYTIAKDVKLQLEFNPANVQSYRLIGYENRVLENKDFNNDRKDAGEIGAGHTVTALYEIIPAGLHEPDPKVDPLKYQPGKTVEDYNESDYDNRDGTTYSDELLTIKMRYKKPDGKTSMLMTHIVNVQDDDRIRGSENFRWSAAVAEFGMLLRDSEYKGHSNWNMVIDTARNAIGKDGDGYRREFIGLAEKARDLSAARY